MSYQKLDENNRTVRVSEKEHLREFMESIREVKQGCCDSIAGPAGLAMFQYAIDHLNLPDTIRARAVAVMNSTFYRQLLECEAHLEPKKRRFRVEYDVKRSGNHSMEVEAETEEDARNMVQNKLDQMEDSEFDDMRTDFLAADVFDAEEVKG